MADSHARTREKDIHQFCTDATTSISCLTVKTKDIDRRQKNITSGSHVPHGNQRVLINGGKIDGTLVLVNAGRSKEFQALEKDIQLLEARFGDEIKISSEYTQQLSQPTKQVISSALESLTRSEIDALRQKKKRLSDYYQKVIKERVAGK